MEKDPVAIEKCPPELIQYIVSSLSKTDLATFQRTSKSLRVITLPSLYKTIHWEFQNPATTKAPIHLLLRTLLKRPELGAFIQYLDIMQLVEACSVWVDDQPALTNDELEELAQKGRGYTNNNPRTENWLEQLNIGNHDTFVTILLWYSPNIKKLVLQNDFYRCLSWNKDWKTVPNYNTLWEAIVSLQNLEEIDCDNPGETEIPWSVPRMPLLLQLPRISTIRISIVDEEVCSLPRGWNRPKIIPGQRPPRPYSMEAYIFEYPEYSPTIPLKVDNIVAPNLKTIELYNSMVTEHSIKGLVAAAPNLRTLHVQLRRIMEGWYNDNYLDLDILRYALTAKLNDRQSQGNLESITIKTIHEDALYEAACQFGGPLYNEHGHLFLHLKDFWDSGTGIKGSLGSLKELTNLKRLHLAPAHLLGWYPHLAPPLRDVLPASVTHLCFGPDYKCWESHLWSVEALIALFIQFGSGQGITSLQNVKFIFIEPQKILGRPSRSLPGDIQIPILRQVIEDCGLEYAEEVTDDRDDQYPSLAASRGGYNSLWDRIPWEIHCRAVFHHPDVS